MSLIAMAMRPAITHPRQQAEGLRGRDSNTLSQPLAGSTFRQQLVEEHAPPGGLAAWLVRNQRNRLPQDGTAHTEPVDRRARRHEVEVTPGVTDEIPDVGQIQVNFEASHQSRPWGSRPASSSPSDA